MFQDLAVGSFLLAPYSSESSERVSVVPLKTERERVSERVRERVQHLHWHTSFICCTSFDFSTRQMANNCRDG